MLDQLALHVGIALIKWGRRPHAAERAHNDEWRADPAELQRARLERDRAVVDAMQFSLRLR